MPRRSDRTGPGLWQSLPVPSPAQARTRRGRKSQPVLRRDPPRSNNTFRSPGASLRPLRIPRSPCPVCATQGELAFRGRPGAYARAPARPLQRTASRTVAGQSRQKRRRPQGGFDRSSQYDFLAQTPAASTRACMIGARRSCPAWLSDARTGSEAVGATFFRRGLDSVVRYGC